MGVQPLDIGAEFVGQHHGLAEPAHPVAAKIAPQVAPKNARRPRETGQSPRGAPGAPYPSRFVVQIFRQIKDRRHNLVMYRMARRIGRVAQRDDANVHAALFQGADFVRDECFGKPRIAFQDDCDRARHRTLSLLHRKRQLRRHRRRGQAGGQPVDV